MQGGEAPPTISLRRTVSVTINLMANARDSKTVGEAALTAALVAKRRKKLREALGMDAAMIGHHFAQHGSIAGPVRAWRVGNNACSFSLAPR